MSRLTSARVWIALCALVDWLYELCFNLVDKWRVARRRSACSGPVAVEAETDRDSMGASKPSEDAPALCKYDVFINHRGPDVKQGFAVCLSDALSRAGFYPFLDAKSIQQGHHVFQRIEEAISDASVHVAIFSERYAESKYCLQELHDMVRTHKVIIPVFYNVKPEHLRWIESGPYAHGFRKHRNRGRHDEILKWREALAHVSERRGFRKDEFNGDENELVKSIVAAVQRESKANLQPQKGRRFGLVESLQEVLDKLTGMTENVGVIGLVGMGGIGKTTLATEIYNHYVSRREFVHHSFLKDVRSSELVALQYQLVNDLVKEDMQRSARAYRNWFDASFRSQKMLIVVDDIDSASQFEDLIPDVRGLARGSRVVVTSRHRDVIKFAMREAEHKEVYEVKVLNPFDSRLLFNWHAFYCEAPSKAFRDLAETVADACGGHPLALEVIGASLFDKKSPDDRVIWMDAVRILKENHDILDKLRLSYTSLPTVGDKAMFRDIACLMIGMREEVALELWNSCRSCGDDCATTKGPHLVLRRLVDKSLVKLDAGRLGMHDVIRDMGRDAVVKEAPREAPWERTHLWDTVTAAKVLTKKRGTYRIRGIKLSTMESKSTPVYEAEQFASMDELHLLILDGCLLVGEDYSRLSQELRWLQWRLFPGTQLPSGLDLPKLVVLDLSDSSSLSSLWQDDDLIQFPALQRLILTSCRGLQKLPRNMGQSIPGLKALEMENCSLIAVLPDSIAQLKHLEHMILFGCENLESLPDGVVNLTQLKRLLLNDCSKLKRLPMEVGRLLNLEVLNLSNCKALLELPPSVKGLRMLKELHMKSTCQSDGRLLSFIGTLTALKTLHLCRNEMITVVPRSFEDLTSLLRLQMSFCSSLHTVEALPRSLQYLDMINCPQLSHFPSVAKISSLVTLNLCNCKSLTEIDGLEFLTALEDINLAGCTSLLHTEQPVLHCKSLRTCYLSGSKVAVAYDSKWSEMEPTEQVISYYGEAIGYLPNGMAEKILDREWSYENALETTISSETKCSAVIFCFVMHDQGRIVIPEDHGRDCFVMHDQEWSVFPEDQGQYKSACYLKVWIVREGSRVYDSVLTTSRHTDGRNQVYLCTFRRKHPFVQSLQFGDKICVYARAQYSEWKITVQEGAICVVYGENEGQVIAMNSKMLSKDQSTDLVATLGTLVLADHFSSSLNSSFHRIMNVPITVSCFLHKLVEFLQEPKFEKDQTSAESLDILAHETESLSTQDENKLPPEGWIIEPAYGLYSWANTWTLPRAGQGIISFVAQGTNDVNMAISEQPHSRHPMYEIIIGGWLNTSSAIRRTRADREVSFVAAGLLHPGAANPLWVSVDRTTSTIQIGRGAPFQDVIAIYRDPAFYSGTQYISFTTHDTQITYSNVVITDAQQPTLDPHILSEKVDQEVLTGAWRIIPIFGHYSWAQYWMLPQPGRGVLSFTAEGEKDIHVAISARPHNMEPMYEINFGASANNRTLIRRKLGGHIQCGVDFGGLTSPVNHLWVSMDDRSGIIQLGQGAPGQNMYCIYKDPAFISEAQYFSFTTMGSPVIFSNIAVTAILD